MLDIKYLRENEVKVKAALLKRMDPADLDLATIFSLDDKRKEIIGKVEELKSERNKFSKTKPDAATITRMKSLGEEIAALDSDLANVEADFSDKMLALPNIPADDVVAGGKENNKVVYTFSELPKFDFTPKDHVELATTLDIIDYERAAKMSGSGFWIYKGAGALLEWALLNYFIDFHTTNGYTFIIPPFLLNEASATASGHLPKFRDDLFWTEDKLCLNATSEMMLGNYHRDEILSAAELPHKYFAYSACFRREAGSYRKEERGMIRGHQFNKIEMFQYTRPEESWTAFDQMRSQAEKLLAGLGLHFQTSQLAAGDCSAAMAKTIDLEVWIPSMGVYKEVSSVSNSLDYQCRRGAMRFKNKETGKTEFMHTLNGSGLATSRLLPAILEQFQQADGSVVVPEVLRRFLPNNLSVISLK